MPLVEVAPPEFRVWYITYEGNIVYITVADSSVTDEDEAIAYALEHDTFNDIHKIIDVTW